MGAGATALDPLAAVAARVAKGATTAAASRSPRKLASLPSFAAGVVLPHARRYSKIVHVQRLARAAWVWQDETDDERFRAETRAFPRSSQCIYCF